MRMIIYIHACGLCGSDTPTLVRVFECIVVVYRPMAHILLIKDCCIDKQVVWSCAQTAALDVLHHPALIQRCRKGGSGHETTVSPLVRFVHVDSASVSVFDCTVLQ